jgi:predicted nucleic acid-binding protein
VSGEDRVVIDSSVLLDIFTDAAPDRLQAAVDIIKAAERGDVELVLPAIVIAEVAGAGSIRGDHLTPDVQAEKTAKVRDWLNSSRFTVIDVDRRVAMRAAELASIHQLKGADACILAAAALWSCPDLYTNDEGLLKVGRDVAGVYVRRPQTFPAQGVLDT